MKNLLIIGAGGCGREVLQWINDINKVTPTWNIKGFLDDDLDALQGKECSISVISRVDDYQIEADDEFVCSIGNSRIREMIVKKFESKGAGFVNVIHPSANIAETAKLGKAVILYPFSLVSDNAVIGNGSIVNMYSSVAHDSVLGEYCTISAHCDITGMCTVGDRVFMGTTSQIIPSTKVGDDVYICAGSTVMGNVRTGRKVLGNPAKPIKL